MSMAQKTNADDTCRAIGSLISNVKPDECGNYFRNAGYASVKS
jgi:hypothetical protein